MKKNQIVLIGVLSSILLLFFMLVYKSDKEHSFSGESKISIYVENGITLPNSDSLRYLINVFSAEAIGTPQDFTQTTLDIYTNGTPEEISSRPTGIAKLRNFFSSNYYTFEDRVSDINGMHASVSEYSNKLKSTSSPAPTNTDIVVYMNGEGILSLSYSKLKDSITSLLNGQKRDLIISVVTNGTGGKGGTGDIYEGPEEPKSPKDPKDPKVPKLPEDPKIPKLPKDPPAGGCKKNNVSTSEITFEPGLPNVFSWVENEGMTYDFSLKCAQGNCETGLSVTKSNVSGGQVEIRASYEESTEKKYIATLTIKCDGKVLKTITKTVKIVCA
jgi:hypothetical protein